MDLTKEQTLVLRQALAEFGAKNCCGDKNRIARELLAKFPPPQRPPNVSEPLGLKNIVRR